jgi:hypothetical protein
VLSSCSKEDYTLDFRNIEVYVNDYPRDSDQTVDSVIARDNYIHELWKKDGLLCQSDKNSYQLGDPVYLTLKNETKDETLHIYPSEEESARYNFNVNKEQIGEGKQNIVSTNPAIIGYIYHQIEDYYLIQINPLNGALSKHFKLNGFDEPLKPGEEMTFKIFLPQKKGTFRFVFFNFDHEGEGIGTWGLRKSWYSNSFEIY